MLNRMEPWYLRVAAATSFVLILGGTYWYYNRKLKFITSSKYTETSTNQLLQLFHTSSTSSPKTIALLIDNGSLRPASVISLRTMAAELQQRIHDRIPVIAASARISNRITKDEIEKAYSTLDHHNWSMLHHPIEQPLIVETAIQRYYEQGYTHYLIIPAFLGPSETITEYIPQIFKKFLSNSSKNYASLTYIIGKPLVNIPNIEKPITQIDEHTDTRIARILIDHINQVWKNKTYQNPSIAICDHGSPSLEVSQVRNYITNQVQLLAPKVFPTVPRSITACSMERRPEKIYDFNEPLLETLLTTNTNYSSGEIIVSLLFISPGKHAGSNGDIENIIQNSIKENKTKGYSMDITMSPLLNSHPLLMDILVERIEELLTEK